MPTPNQEHFLAEVYAAAKAANHIFPGAAAAEAVYESAWGSSKLALQARNLFGLKKSTIWTGPTISIPTREYLNKTWVTVDAVWPVFTDFAECMQERMKTLHRVGRYGPVFLAKNEEEYIHTVSPLWATDPSRATVVTAIFNHNLSLLTS